jgi:hypothetical protein
MDLTSIIDDLADRADDFLEGATSREQAQAGVSEAITVSFPYLAAADRTTVIKSVMAILEEEGFFEAMPQTNTASQADRGIENEN